MNKLHQTILDLRNYILFWFGQTISQIGSSISSFAIVLWVYDQTKSPLSIALLSVFIWVPKIVFGMIAGSLVDRLNKKFVILFSDCIIAVLSFVLFVLVSSNKLDVWHIYVCNVIIGVFSCLQSAASEVVQSVIVPKKYYVATDGMRSFSRGAGDIMAPVLAAVLYSIAGMKLIIIVDLSTFVLAFISLSTFVRIPKIVSVEVTKLSFIQFKKDLQYSSKFINENNALRCLMVYFCFVNFFSGITYFSLLSPMILGRSGNNSSILAFVNMLMGVGMICGGIFAATIKVEKNRMMIVYGAVGLSFALGDIFFAVGKSPFVWCIAAFFASFFIPVSNANENYFWRTNIPVEFQGRVFSSRDAIQSAMRPVGMLLGGYLAENIFEPLIHGNNRYINYLVGSSKGSGIGLMFLLTGVFGMVLSIIIYNKYRKNNKLAYVVAANNM